MNLNQNYVLKPLFPQSTAYIRGVQPFAIAGRITLIYMKYGHQRV